METAEDGLPSEHALAPSAPPVLVVMPDPEAHVDLGLPILGRTLASRMAEAARAAGFSRVVTRPGSRHAPEDAEELSVGDEINAPALVVTEGTLVARDLLRLMVEHPLEDDERFTLYDEVGRPAALFTGWLNEVPDNMPIGEEIDWPEGYGAANVARLVYPEDRERIERLVLRDAGVFALVGDSLSKWHREVSLRTLRRLATQPLDVAQLELVALLLAIGAGLLVLVPFAPILPLAGLLLLVGVHVARLLHAHRLLRAGSTPREPAAPDELLSDEATTPVWIPGDTLARATRPLAHAVLTAALTYVLVVDRPNLAGLVLLAMGGAAMVLSLAHARALLRNQKADALAIPGIAGLGRRLGVEPFTWLQGAPVLEIFVFLGCLTMVPAVPWGVLVSAAASRLWRWFVIGQSPGLVGGANEHAAQPRV